MPQSFVKYHGCNQHCYKDGTREQVQYHCSRATIFPFWKHQRDATNTIAASTRAQLKNKSLATKEEIEQYKNQQKWKLPTADTYNSSEVETARNNLTGDNLIIAESN